MEQKLSKKEQRIVDRFYRPKMDKKGELMGPNMFLLWGAAIIVIIIFFTLGATLNSDMRTDLDPGTTAYNISIAGDEALEEGANKTKTIMMVVAFSIIIALLLGVAYLVGTRN